MINYFHESDESTGLGFCVWCKRESDIKRCIKWFGLGREIRQRHVFWWIVSKNSLYFYTRA